MFSKRITTCLFSHIHSIAIISLLLIQLSINLASASESPTLIFGLLPSESAVTKFKRYAPLRDYLATKLNRKIRLETARDFKEFLLRTKKGRYDFLETAPHFVIPAIDSKKYTVITTIIQPLTANIVVLKTSKHTKISSLASLTVATPSPKAIITKIGKATVNKYVSKPVTFNVYKTHNAAYESVLGKRTDAAIISVNVFNKAIRQNIPLKTIGKSKEIPNMSILVSSRIDAPTKKSLQTTLVDMLKSKEGKSALKKISYPGYIVTQASEFNILRKYLK